MLLPEDVAEHLSQHSLCLCELHAAGFPHTTDTVNTGAAGEAAEEDSVHLTVGIDTHIWGLNYASMRSGALARAKLPNTLNECTLPSSSYWRLMGVPATLGFLSRHSSSATHAAVACELASCIELAETSRWAGVDRDKLMESLDIKPIVQQVEKHTKSIVAVQRAMYMDAAKDVRPNAPGMPRVSIFRVKEHMAKLEAAMDSHLQWYGPEAMKRVMAAAAAQAAAAAPSSAMTSSAKSSQAARSKEAKSTGGFGSGGGSRGVGKKKMKGSSRKKR